MPIYKNGLYFLFDTTMKDVPENKRINGFKNLPSYILDNGLNLVNELDDNCYSEYKEQFC